jgi:hypothetical protein
MHCIVSFLGLLNDTIVLILQFDQVEYLNDI